MTTDPMNPFPAPTAAPAVPGRSDDPVPPTAPSSIDRDQFDAWMAERDTARAAAPGAPEPGEPGCPFCGASFVNPAFHEVTLSKLHCWKCGYGSAPGQDYNPPAAADTVTA